MSGLDSIALAVAHLEDLGKQKEREAAKAETTIASISPVPTTAHRVVSTDSIYGASQDENDSLPVPPKNQTAGATVKVDSAGSTTSDIPTQDQGTTRVPSPVQGKQPKASPTATTEAAVVPPGSPAPNTSIPRCELAVILADPGAWLKTTEYTPLPEAPSGTWDKVQRHDVLCGRGGESNHHPGNQQYRRLVKAFQPLYIASKRRDKPLIAQCIVYTIRSYGGRFLKRLDPRSNDFEDVGNTKAREKTSQALREGAPELRGNKDAPSPSSGDGNPPSEAAKKAPVLPAARGPSSQQQPLHGTQAMPNPGIPPMMLLQLQKQQQPPFGTPFHPAFHTPFPAGFAPLHRPLVSSNTKEGATVSTVPSGPVMPAASSFMDVLAQASTTKAAVPPMPESNKRPFHVVSSSEDSNSTASENSASEVIRGPRLKRLKQRLSMQPVNQFDDADEGDSCQ
eukprot:Nitzschia sp. Nitz4//scaffold267_size26297//10630//11985//NITZ4_008267-RA/size26297-processed-gene-0.5-mRNA-1//-1//CDS//3329544899//789//frame0